MSAVPGCGNQAGALLASRLGLTISRREGHDLAGPCIACNSSDAFRMHETIGIAQCYSCGGKWSPFQVAEAVLHDRDQAKAMMIELGFSRPFPTSAGWPASIVPSDPIAVLAQTKGITPESLRVFGAKVISPYTVQLPAYGPDGTQCTHFSLFVHGGKGKFAYGKKAGLFFPHERDKVRLPQPGEEWHVVEGCKDAAALHELGLSACGLNTCRLAAKFARLFKGVNVILIPDRDSAGEEGARHSARVLRGMASSVRVAVLPAEFKESDGDDVRDVLRRPGGRELLLQAIADAEPAEQLKAFAPDGKESGASADVILPDGDSLRLTVSPCFGKPQRLVVAERGETSHRDRINTDSSISRNRFVKHLAEMMGMAADTLSPLVDPRITALADEVDVQTEEEAHCGEGEEQSQATLAANMAAAWDLWHTPAKEAYATFPVDSHNEIWPIKSRTFGQYVVKCFFDEQQKAMNSNALSAAVNLIEAKALFEGEEHAVHVRVASHEGKVYIDLCNAGWQVVEVTATGWQIIDESPVKFRRSGGMLALPPPERGGRIDELRQHLNVKDDTWVLLVAWLVAAFCPRGPYPILALFAEQGSGKSTTGRLLRDLIDPNAASLRAEPRDARDLMIGANNSWCLAYDNLSHIPPWLSDALCRLSTGGGFATRELYTDQDEVIFDSQRPVLLTSIEEVANRADLLDRCVIVWLPAIPEDRRRPEAEILQAFEEAQPRILGTLLDAVAGALENLSSTKLDTLPRMADFAIWVTAAEASLGWPKGTFEAAYAGNRASANDVALEASPVARPLLELLDTQGSWKGSSSELLQALEARVGEQVKRQRAWPSNGRAMTSHLKRLSPNLRVVGWQVEPHRTSSRRVWSIQRHATSASSDPFASPEVYLPATQTDAIRRDLFPDDANDADDANTGSVSSF